MNAIEKAKELIRDYETLPPTTDRAQTLPLLRLLVECEEALKWYGAQEHWRYNQPQPMWCHAHRAVDRCDPTYFSRMNDDRGAIARALLDKLRSES